MSLDQNQVFSRLKMGENSNTENKNTANKKAVQEQNASA